MRLPDWITWPRMDWRLRALLRWYLVVQVICISGAIQEWPTSSTTQLLGILIGTPLISLWLPLAFVFSADTPGRVSIGSVTEGTVRALLTTVLTLAFWILSLVVIVALVALAYHVVVGPY